ncbi:MAG: choice-of-anchor L domain-containing protein [Saprospiraceae bacterium]|nr:choice-of-anchor L domain-containing protein [Saprospiraceae bacterium]MCB9322173.1 choice-of-anchor L domain-containing protein [Lewinellaceae bacterium]
MKRLYFLFFLLYSAILATAQPVNDNCDGIIDLGVPPTCPNDMIYNNVNATASNIGFGNIPNCFNGGTVQNDVWFMFTTSDTIFDYTIYLEGATDNGNSILNPQIALYRGDCTFDGLSEIACISAGLNETYLELDVLGLTPNIQYFIRINDYSASATPNWGDFRLCVDELEPVNTIDEGGSTLCSGELFDSGGPDGDYGNNENYTFTICPDQPNSCILFTLDYYNIEVSDFGVTDQLIFYDSDEADPGAVIANLAGDGFDGGGGGVCYMVQASSGCMTVQFISDGSNAFEGWGGSWQCSNQPCEAVNPITVESGITEEQILDFITTPQTTVTITDVNCAQGAYGIFETGDNSNLGLDRGLLLTSGDLNWAVGPNDDGGGGNFNSNNGFPGDADLDYLSITFGDGDLSNNACIIEMDVFVATDELVFEYVFGSEEYPEFVNQFNDIFAFLISGPGIAGDPNINNQQNIAVLPDGNNTFVEINSVNNLVNWQYYRDNTGGQSVQYDGLTSDYLGVKKSLTARSEVIPCNTYHLKLAIADRGDTAWDSGVFISELKGGAPNMAINFNSGIDYLIEDCTNQPDDLVITLSSPQADTVSYNVVIGGLGTAELGVDYLLDIPETIVFPPGVTELSFPITVLSDLEVEPIEIIQISLTSDFGCGLIELTSVAVELHDALSVNIIPGQDTTFVCQGSNASLGVTGAATYFWTPVAVFSDAQSENPTVTPTQSMWVNVVGNVGICSAEDSIYLQIIDPEIQINALDPVAICQGDNVTLEVADNVNHTGLFWTPTNNIDDPNGSLVTVDPLVPTNYIATVNLYGCAVSDTVSISVSPFTFPVMAEDTTICENYSVQLAYLDQLGTTTYSWTPAEAIDDPLSPTPIGTPDITTTYQLIAISANEACRDTAQVTVTVLPADIAITNPDTTFLCLGETIDINAITSLGTPDNVVWTSSDNSVSVSDVLSVTVTPQLTTAYFTAYQVGACMVFDSVLVRVDSLPNSTLIAIPEKDPYCPGEIVTLISPTYEPSDFPDIQLEWLNGLGYQTPDSLWNMVFITQDSFLYQRVTHNNACLDTASILINVQQPPNMSITPENPTICAGDQLQLMLSYDGEGGIEWSPEVCNGCLDPVVSPTGVTTYTATSDDACPSSTSVTVNVTQLPIISVIDDLTICESDNTPIQLYNGNVQAGVGYNWTSPDDPNVNVSDAMYEVNPNMTTTYDLAADNECGTVEESVTLTVVEEPTLTLNDIQICLGDEAVLEAVSDLPGGIPEIFEWSYNGVTQTGNPLVIPDLAATTEVTLSYSYGDDCGTLTETATISVVGNNFSVSLTAEPDTVYIGGATLLTANIESDPPLAAGAAYEWFMNGQSLGTSTVPTFTATNIPGDDNAEIYQTFSVTVTSVDGCERMDETDVLVLFSALRIPNVFTPNGDDYNDVFKIYHTDGVQVKSVRVYNRWGQMVFETTTDEAWDGTYKGEPAQSDVYIYTTIYVLNGDELEESGEITLLR